MPTLSISLIVKTRAPELLSSSCSPESSERTPTSAVRSGSTAGSRRLGCANSSPARPRAAASGIPCTFPDGLVAGVLRSPCASSQIHPRRRRGAREPGERPERNRVVAAEHERHRAARDRFSDERGDTRARLEDLRQVTRALVAQRRRLRAAPSSRCRGRGPRSRATGADPRDPRSESRTAPCRRRGGSGRGRGRRR